MANRSKKPKNEMRATYERGVLDGRRVARVEILTILENKYLNPDIRPDRDSPEGRAILQLAREVAEEFKVEYHVEKPDADKS